jgi:hypothetical protein
LCDRIQVYNGVLILDTAPPTVALLDEEDEQDAEEVEVEVEIKSSSTASWVTDEKNESFSHGLEEGALEVPVDGQTRRIQHQEIAARLNGGGGWTKHQARTAMISSSFVVRSEP